MINKAIQKKKNSGRYATMRMNDDKQFMFRIFNKQENSNSRALDPLFSKYQMLLNYLLAEKQKEFVPNTNVYTGGTSHTQMDFGRQKLKLAPPSHCSDSCQQRTYHTMRSFMITSYLPSYLPSLSSIENYKVTKPVLLQISMNSGSICC